MRELLRRTNNTLRLPAVQIKLTKSHEDYRDLLELACGEHTQKKRSYVPQHWVHECRAVIVRTGYRPLFTPLRFIARARARARTPRLRCYCSHDDDVRWQPTSCRGTHAHSPEPGLDSQRSNTCGATKRKSYLSPLVIHRYRLTDCDCVCRPVFTRSFNA